MKVISIVLIILLFFGIAFGSEKHTISGDVSFQSDGDIYICSFTKEEWSELLLPGHELSESMCKLIKMNDEEKRSGKVSFKLDSIPSGTYVVVAYQDVNENRRVDYQNYILKEPWGTYKQGNPLNPIPSWDLSNFRLETDLEGVRIQI